MPEERQVTDLYFRQLRKISVGDPGTTPDTCYSLLCVSNRFGLTFVGCKNGVYVFETAILHSVDSIVDLGPQNVMADLSTLRATHVPTPGPPQHMALSSDSLTLSVALKEGAFLKCYFYDVRALAGKVQPVSPFSSIALATDQAVRLCGLAWNPSPDYPHLLAVGLSSDQLQLLEVKVDVKVVNAKQGFPINAICWSPKGKALAAGLKDGTVCQVSPKTFEVKKSYPCPNIFNDNPQQVSDLHWLSPFVFAVVYTPQSLSEAMPSHVFLLTPKDSPPFAINYEDVFYGTGTKAQKFYFAHISAWNILISSSANAVDSAVFGGPEGGGEGWEKWELEDTGRVELPLHNNNDYTFVVGSALALTSQVEVKITEEKSLPPSPILILYSDHGVLCPFTVVNTGCLPEAIRQLVKPPQPFPPDPPRKPMHQPSVPQPESAPDAQPNSQLLQNMPKLFAGDGLPFFVIQQQKTATSGASVFGAAPLIGGGTGPMGTSAGRPDTSTGGLFSLSSLPSSGGAGIPGPFSGFSSPAGGGVLGAATPSKPSFPFSVSSITGAGLVKPPIGQAGTAAGEFKPPVVGMGLPFGSGSRLGTALGPPPLSQAQASAQPQETSGLFSQRLLATVSHSQQLPPSATTVLANQHGLMLPPPTTAPPKLQTTTTSAAQDLGMQASGQAQPWMGMAPSHRPPPYSSAPTSVTPPHTTTKPLGAGGLPLGVPPPHVAIQQRSSQQYPPPMASLGTALPSAGTAQGSTAPSHQLQLGRMPPTYSSTPISGGPKLGDPTGLGVVSHRPPLPPTYTASGTAVPPPQIGAYQPQPPPVYKPVGGVPTGLPPQGPQVQYPPPAFQPPTQRPPLHPATAPGPNTGRGKTISTEGIEATFSGHITDQIEKFVDELELLKDELRDTFGEWEDARNGEGTVEGLGTMDDMQILREETQASEAAVREVAEQMKSLTVMSGDLGDCSLKGYELSEEARAKLKKKDDVNYGTLLRLRPLDSHSQRKLDEIRGSYLRIQQSASEINAQLDAEREKKCEEQRQRGRSPLKVPSVQTIYSTLRNHRKIARMQNTNIEQLAGRMKRLRLIPQSWVSTDATVLQSPTLLLSEQDAVATPTFDFTLRTPHTEGELPVHRVLAPEKAEQLREYVSGITRTPVIKPRSTWSRLPAYQHSGRSGLSTPQESQHSRSETPYSTTEGPSSVAEYDMGGTVEELPPAHQYAHQVPVPVSGHAMPSYPLASRIPLPSFPAGTDPQASLQHQTSSAVESTHSIDSCNVMASPQGEVSIRTPHGFVKYTGASHQASFAMERTHSIDSCYAMASPQGDVSSRTPHGFVKRSGENPQHPITSAPGTSTGVIGTSSLHYTHTVNWGAPPSTSTSATSLALPHSQSATPVTTAQAGQTSTAVPSVTATSLLKRTDPLPDLTKIRQPPGSMASLSTTVPSSAPKSPPPATSSVLASPPGGLAASYRFQTPPPSSAPQSSLTRGSSILTQSPAHLQSAPPMWSSQATNLSHLGSAGPGMTIKPVAKGGGFSALSGLLASPLASPKPSPSESKGVLITTTASAITSTKATVGLTTTSVGTSLFQLPSPAGFSFSPSTTGSAPFQFGLGSVQPSAQPNATITASAGSPFTFNLSSVAPFCMPSLGKGATVTVATTSGPQAFAAPFASSGAGYVFGPPSCKVSSNATTPSAASTSSVPQLDPSKTFLSTAEKEEEKEQKEQDNVHGKPKFSFQIKPPTTKPGSTAADASKEDKLTLHMPSAFLSQSSELCEDRDLQGNEEEETNGNEEGDHVVGAEGEEKEGVLDNEVVKSKPPPQTSRDLSIPGLLSGSKEEDSETKEEHVQSMRSANFPLPPATKPPSLPSAPTDTTSTCTSSTLPPQTSATSVAAATFPLSIVSTTQAPTVTSVEAPKPDPTMVPPRSDLQAKLESSQPPTSSTATSTIFPPVAALSSTTVQTTTTTIPVGLDKEKPSAVASPPTSQSSLVTAPTSQLSEGQALEAGEESEMEAMENDAEPIEVNNQPETSSSFLGGGLFGSGLGGLGGKGPTNTSANPFGTPVSAGGIAGQTPLRSGVLQLSGSGGGGLIRPASGFAGSTSSGLVPQSQQPSTGLGRGLAGQQFGGGPMFGGTSAPGTGSLFGGGPSFGQQSTIGSAAPLGSMTLDGRVFGSQQTAGVSGVPGNLFQPSAEEGMSFGSIAQSGGGSGIGIGSGSGFGGQTLGSLPSGGTGGTSFSSWR